MKYSRTLSILLALSGVAMAQMPGKMATFVLAEKASAGYDRIIRKSTGRTEAMRHVTKIGRAHV